ncbi:MAG: hypothetical protein MHM6MM_000002 [Cercozoa sp. M6MM]
MNLMEHGGKVKVMSVASSGDATLRWTIDPKELRWPLGFNSDNMIIAHAGEFATPLGVPEKRLLLDTVSLALFIGCVSLCVGAAAVGVCFGFFNHIHRHERIISLSSPQVNNVALAGIICSILCLPLWGVDEAFVSRANMKYLSLCIH